MARRASLQRHALVSLALPRRSHQAYRPSAVLPLDQVIDLVGVKRSTSHELDRCSELAAKPLAFSSSTVSARNLAARGHRLLEVPTACRERHRSRIRQGKRATGRGPASPESLVKVPDHVPLNQVVLCLGSMAASGDECSEAAVMKCPSSIRP